VFGGYAKQALACSHSSQNPNQKQEDTTMKNHKYFSPAPQTAEELKKQYRELAHNHHPDNGGDIEVMKAVNAEYAELFPRLKDIHQNKDGEKYT